ncbi:MAG: hypothetical protein H7Y31_01940 [Chitinophagaceae bacterium]|nr:hypothetical protein [Chitinophagaceae bacterium]
MKKFFLFATVLCLTITCIGQVKIGNNPTVVNPAAVLELSNDPLAAPNSWKGFLPPRVDFSNAVFTNASIWGIAGAATPGTIVYNTADIFTNGFSGPGFYCWHRNAWVLIRMLVQDNIRAALTTNIVAYDAAALNSWVSVTAAEYANVLNTVSGSSRYGMPEILMSTSSTGGWAVNNTVGGNINASTLPPASYIVAWAIRTGTLNSSALGTKLKIGLTATSGYASYANPLTSTTTIGADSRLYFVLKAPFAVTPNSPGYLGVYTGVANYIGRVSGGGASEFFTVGDLPDPATPSATGALIQVIATQTRQW